MRIDVRLFASYREAAGVGRFDLELPAGATVRDAVAQIVDRHPIVASGTRVVMARNREYVDADAALADGDELALIPPVSGGATASRPRVLVSAAPLSVDACLDAVRAPGHGGLVVFVGTVRDHSRGLAVTRLDYEAYPEMAEAKMGEIAARLEREHGARLALHHRVGELEIGEAAVVIAAGAPHRDAAFAAARAAIDELKRIVPIWKKEHTADGAVWIEDHA
ncbi:MAG TPA: molybdopterin converting factor subunit 1 [Candidatus Limnocylindria bacterium]|nr:molybdopterin converting factor subunit 1 [Candidatus Limnocylindria bacterium]